MVPRAPLCGGAGLLRALTATLPCHALKLVRIETDAVWRLSRCSLVLCFSLEVTRACADARWVSGAGGVSFTS